MKTQKEWVLTVNFSKDEWDEILSKNLVFTAASDKEMRQKTMVRMKKVAKRFVGRGVFVHGFLTGTTEKDGKRYINGDKDMYRSKSRLGAPSRILRSSFRKLFVRGYGPKVAKKIFE